MKKLLIIPVLVALSACGGNDTYLFPEIEYRTQTTTETSTGAETFPETQIETQINTETASQIETSPETFTESQINTETEITISTETETFQETTTESQIETSPETQSQINTTTEITTSTETDITTETNPIRITNTNTYSDITTDWNCYHYVGMHNYIQLLGHGDVCWEKASCVPYDPDDPLNDEDDDIFPLSQLQSEAIESQLIWENYPAGYICTYIINSNSAGEQVCECGSPPEETF